MPSRCTLKPVSRQLHSGLVAYAGHQVAVRKRQHNPPVDVASVSSYGTCYQDAKSTMTAWDQDASVDVSADHEGEAHKSGPPQSSGTTSCLLQGIPYEPGLQLPPWVPDTPLMFNTDQHVSFQPVPKETSAFAGYWAFIDGRTTPAPLPCDLIMGCGWMVHRIKAATKGIKVRMQTAAAALCVAGLTNVQFHFPHSAGCCETSSMMLTHTHNNQCPFLG